ncbi:hypothetical protein JMUB6875_55300 [Nocardia sp. JMUB6875]
MYSGSTSPPRAPPLRPNKSSKPIPATSSPARQNTTGYLDIATPDPLRNGPSQLLSTPTETIQPHLSPPGAGAGRSNVIRVMASHESMLTPASFTAHAGDRDTERSAQPPPCDTPHRDECKDG